MCVLAMVCLLALAARATPELDAINDAYADNQGGNAYAHLRRLLETVARQNLAPAEAAQYFAALLHPDVDYVHQGRGHWHGLQRVVDALVREQRDEHGLGSGRVQSTQTLAHGTLHAVRELTELRRGGERQARRLDVYFLTLSAGGLVRQLERMPTVEDPYLVAGAAGAPAKRSPPLP